MAKAAAAMAAAGTKVVAGAVAVVVVIPLRLAPSQIPAHTAPEVSFAAPA